jgi:hypothetical protein
MHSIIHRQRPSELHSHFVAMIVEALNLLGFTTYVMHFLPLLSHELPYGKMDLHEMKTHLIHHFQKTNENYEFSLVVSPISGSLKRGTFQFFQSS